MCVFFLLFFSYFVLLADAFVSSVCRLNMLKILCDVNRMEERTKAEKQSATRKYDVWGDGRQKEGYAAPLTHCFSNDNDMMAGDGGLTSTFYTK